MTHVTDNPPDEFPNSDDQTYNTPNPTGIISAPPLYTKRPTRLNKLIRFNFLPKRKQSLHHNNNHNTSTLHPSTVQNPTIPNYSTVNTNPNDYSIFNTSVNNGNECPGQFFSLTKYYFTWPSF